MPTPTNSPFTAGLRLPIPPDVVERMFRVNAVREVWRKALRRSGDSLHQRLLDELEVTSSYTGSTESIPKTGPLVVVANHPFGMIEGPILGALLETVRQDVLFVTNSLLSELEELRPSLIAVNPYGRASHANAGAVRRALQHLQGGGALVIFPAGEVSSMQPPFGRIADAAWQPMAARLALATGARMVPIYFAGTNGAAFQIAGLVHPVLRTCLLPSELLGRRRRGIRFVIGQPIEAESFEGAARLTQFLRLRVYGLAKRVSHEPVAPAVPEEELRQEIRGLRPVCAAGAFAVYLERARAIPAVLREIGRLRELTFRGAGEGTGQSTDLDEFDRVYWHLFLWNREDGAIAGAYRLAHGAESGGPSQSYTRTLFQVPPSWEKIAAQGVELGRSFVALKYQKEFLPLLLLWKGIGIFVMERPGVRFLFGPVSVSADYSLASRAAIAAHFSRWARGFRPRNPLTHALSWRPLRPPMDIKELNEHIVRLEPDAKGLPVLLRHYLHLGGEILCLNLDPKFGNVLDGLVLLDLRNVPSRLLTRYFGDAAAQRFRDSSN